MPSVIFLLEYCKFFQDNPFYWTNSIISIIEYTRILYDISFERNIKCLLYYNDNVIEIFDSPPKMSTILKEFAKINSKIIVNSNINSCNFDLNAILKHINYESGTKFIFITHRPDFIKNDLKNFHTFIEFNNIVLNATGQSCMDHEFIDKATFYNYVTNLTDLQCLILYLIQRHFKLCSTTISGIPMKEEQNTSGTSINYDVEIIHSQYAYLYSDGVIYRDKIKLIENGVLDFEPESLKTRQVSSKSVLSGNFASYRSVLLQWSTFPKNMLQSLDYYQQNSQGAFKVSPVEPHSRPSSCLTNFVLSNRIVLLEQQQNFKKFFSVYPYEENGSKAKTPLENNMNVNISVPDPKVMTHMLCHIQGAIYILSLIQPHSPGTQWKKALFENVAGITEGPGGKITDYRIPDFCKLIKLCTLTQACLQNGVEQSILGLSHIKPEKVDDKYASKQNRFARQQLNHLTMYWPIVYSDSLLFHIPMINPIFDLISTGLRSINEHDREKAFEDCCELMDSLREEELQGHSLPIPPALITKALVAFENCGNGNSLEENTTGKSNLTVANKKRLYKCVWQELYTLIMVHYENYSSKSNSNSTNKIIADLFEKLRNHLFELVGSTETFDSICGIKSVFDNSNTVNATNEKNGKRAEDLNNNADGNSISPLATIIIPQFDEPPINLGELMQRITQKEESEKRHRPSLDSLMVNAIENKVELYPHIKDKTNPFNKDMTKEILTN